MPFQELANPDELTSFLNDNSDGCIVTFSATWCGVGPSLLFTFDFVCVRSVGCWVIRVVKTEK